MITEKRVKAKLEIWMGLYKESPGDRYIKGIITGLCSVLGMDEMEVLNELHGINKKEC